MPKKPFSRAKQPSPPGKTPRSEMLTANQRCPRWSFARVDIEGPWSWRHIHADHLCDLLQRLGAYETLTWQQIKQETGSHLIPQEQLVKEAQTRLQEIDQDDVAELFSLRISGQRRVWGILDNEVLRLLWWDAEHQVCPSLKKHT